MGEPSTTRQCPGRVVIFQPSDDNYGLDRVFIRIVDALLEANWEVSCLVERDNPGSGWVSQELVRRGVPLSKRPLANLSRRAISNPLCLLRWLGRVVANVPPMVRLARNADVVYVNGFTLMTAAVAGRLGHRRVVWHVHEIPPAPRLAGRIIRTLSHRQICVSRAVEDALGLSKCGTSEVIYNAVDIPDRAVEQPEVSDDRPLEIGIVARINRHKGHLVLAEAFEQLVARGLPVRLHIVGSAHPSDTSVEEELKRRLSALPADRVVWAGEVESGAEYMQRLHVLVAPSTFAEPLGISVLEGMAAGAAVVASCVGGHPEVIGGPPTGILVPVGNASELVRALICLAEDIGLRQSTAAAGRARAAASFAYGSISSQVAAAAATTLRAHC